MAALTGEAGAGKTVGLWVVQHWWSLPPLRARADKRSSPDKREYHTGERTDNNSPPVVLLGKDCPAWLPLCLDLTDRDNLDFNEVLRFALKNCTTLLRAIGSQSCTADLLFRYSRFDNLRWLLNSPILVLIDGCSALSTPQLRAASRAVRDLLFMGHGVIVAIRNIVEYPDDDGNMLGNEVRLRPMNRRQFEQLVERRLPESKILQQTVKDLLHVIDRPLSTLVRTPYLLDKICDLVDNMTDVASLNLYELMRAYVERRMLIFTGDNVRRTIHGWLPSLAFNRRASGVPQQLPPGPSYVTEAIQLGFIRSAGPSLEFEHDLLCDFFAAKYLADAIQDKGAHCLHELVKVKSELSSDWEDVFRMLAGLLWDERNSLPGEMVAYLHRVQPRLALSCLREFPREVIKNIPQAERVLGSVVSRINDRSESLLKDTSTSQRRKTMKELIDDAEALAFLDPRFMDLETDPSMMVDNMVDLVERSGHSTIRIGRYPVTNLEFARFVADGGYREERYWAELPHAWEWRAAKGIQHPALWDQLEFNGPNHPVVGVSVYEAIAYCHCCPVRSRTESIG